MLELALRKAPYAGSDQTPLAQGMLASNESFARACQSMFGAAGIRSPTACWHGDEMLEVVQVNEIEPCNRLRC
jgi:hypothetical protein